MTDDTRRFDFMAEYEAKIAWNREGEVCSVWVPSDECGEYDRPAEGYPVKAYDSAREAIDAAMKFLRNKP